MVWKIWAYLYCSTTRERIHWLVQPRMFPVWMCNHPKPVTPRCKFIFYEHRRNWLSDSSTPTLWTTFYSKWMTKRISFCCSSAWGRNSDRNQAKTQEYQQDSRFWKENNMQLKTGTFFSTPSFEVIGLEICCHLVVQNCGVAARSSWRHCPGNLSISSGPICRESPCMYAFSKTFDIKIQYWCIECVLDFLNKWAQNIIYL